MQLLPQQVGPINQFGLQLGVPPPPTFVSSQSVDAFEQDYLVSASGSCTVQRGSAVHPSARDANPGHDQSSTAPCPQSHIEAPSDECILPTLHTSQRTEKSLTPALGSQHSSTVNNPGNHVCLAFTALFISHFSSAYYIMHSAGDSWYIHARA